MTGLRDLRSIAAALAGISGAIALIGLSGVIIRSDFLISGGTMMAGMSPVTATCLLCLAAAIIASTRERIAVAQALAAFACGLAAAILATHAFLNGDRLSPIVLRAVADRDLPSARTSVATALAIFMIASSLFTSRSRRVVADVSAATAVTISVTALLGYVLSVSALYEIPIFSTMALNTAVSLFGLSVGALSLPFVQTSEIERQNIWTRVLHTAPLMLVPIATCVLLVASVNLNMVAGIAVVLLVMLAGFMPFCFMIWRDDGLSRI